ncbi:major allergen I polypeptide chain 1-like [Perognathus longimembris pacificus]|uniref:major allergen I polypeptide chain 1-like n=1 Tax=Perognathus longimembris pacificus TaxID=214514 RepID=UPI00201A0B8D|nr:major allergen I polypeptide chain 1-like [Perognathus longimembris pacificus]
MTPTGALALLAAALLLTAGGRCDVCPSVREDVRLFVHGSRDAYLSKVAEYRGERPFVRNAGRLKACVDAKLSARDKELVDSGLPLSDAQIETTCALSLFAPP